MKIAFTFEELNPAKGGCETYLVDLLRRLARDDHELHVYGVSADREALPPEVFFHPLVVSRGPRFLRLWRFAAECERALAGENYDVVVGLTHTWRQDVLVPQGGLPTINARFNLQKCSNPIARGLSWLGQRLSPTYWSLAQIEHKTYVQRPPPLVVVPSHFVLGHLVAKYAYGPDVVRVNPNAIDPQRFVAYDRPLRRLQLREQLDLKPTDVVALFSGHNYRLKGLGPLLRALALVRQRPCHLLVCGSRKFAGYQRMAERLGIAKRVHFLGFVEDVRDCYFASDFLIHPTFYDPCALVTFEALACALPIITTLCNGASELLPPALAEHVIDDPHDAANLARHIEQLCDPVHRTALARVARQAAAAWTFEDHYQALLQILREAAARKQAA